MARLTKTYPLSQIAFDAGGRAALGWGMFYDGANVLWDNRSLRAPGVVFGEIRYRPGGLCGPRAQRDFQLVILHSGACRLSVDGRAQELRVGSATLLRPGGREHFRFAPDAETHHTWCSLAPDRVPTDLRRRLAKAPASAPCSETFRHLHAAAFELAGPVREPGRRVLLGLALCLFHEYAHMARADGAGAPRMAPVHAALRHMEEHFGREDCLAGAHRAAGISRNALIYKFREAMRLTPARYLWRLRVERGVAMLAETGLTISEISGRCGFSNPFHFSRLVRQAQGAPPREVRRRIWEGR